MERAPRIEQARIIERDFLSTPVAPMVIGSVVEVWRDRLAISMDAGSPLPSEGSFIAVYDRAGNKADAYVVRVRGRMAFTQFRLLGSCTTPEVGDRTAGQR